MHYIDIETVSRYESYFWVPAREKNLFEKKFAREIKERTNEHGPEEYRIYANEAVAEIYLEKAGLHAEFNKIVCISMGTIRFKPLTDAQVQAELNLGPIVEHKEDGVIRLQGRNTPDVETKREEEWYARSFTGHDEKTLLMEFAEALKKGKITNLCAHNGKRFDFPQLSRKFIMYRIPLPFVLNTAGKKPWEITFQVDTMDLWGFGEYKYTCSLDLLAYSLGLPSPKANLDGSQVGPLYWSDLESELPLKQIASYCETDIFTCCNVHRVLNYLKPLL